jgi:hypothetical protein
MADPEEPILSVGEEARHRPLEDDLRALVDRGLAYARTELALQQARAGYAAGRIKGIALLAALAAVFAFFALVALTVGLVVALAPLIGAVLATLAVCGGLLVLAALCALVAVSQWKRMRAALSNREAG